MNFRIPIAGAAVVALALGATSAASAQADTTRRATSQQRVRVTKESAGEVSTRRDSTAMRDSIARADSMARMARMTSDSMARADSMRRDSVSRADSLRRDSTARADSARRPDTTSMTTSDTIRSPITPTMNSNSYGMGRNWYIGLGAGASVPTGNVADAYKTGFDITVPIGWQPQGSPLGLRLDLGYSRLNGKSIGSSGFASQLEDPSIWSATGNLTLDLVRYGANRRGSLYLVGGGGVYRFTSMFSGKSTDNAVVTAFKGDPVTKGGVTGGGGLAFPVGAASLFVESRFTSTFTEGNNTNWVPIIVGLKWR